MNSWHQTDDTYDALEDLHRFEARVSPDGLFLRYCKTRLRSFGSRLVLTLSGSLLLGLLYDPWFGTIAMAFLLIGEAVDCLTLRSILRRREAQIMYKTDRLISKISAVLQSSSIAACVVLTWVLVPYVEASFFAAAYLTGAVINAGLVRIHDPAMANLRITVFAITALASFFLVHLDVYGRAEDQTGALFFFATMALLAYLCFAFIQFVGRTHAHRLNRRCWWKSINWSCHARRCKNGSVRRGVWPWWLNIQPIP